MAQQGYTDAFTGTLDSGRLAEGPSITTATGAPLSTITLQSEANGDGMGLMDGLIEPGAFGDVDMEMDASGAQLWHWFNKNQSMMRMLDDA